MQYLPVKTDEDITTLAGIAHDIWFEYWPDHIGLAQVEYMVDKFQSKSAITRAINVDGYLYFILVGEEGTVGYTGVHIEKEEGRLFLSKLYLYKPERGKGYASKTMRFLVELCKENGLSSIYLTVNKGNDLAIRAYLGMDFKTIDSVETDIGKGFIMDDYIMEKQLG